jgi:hypothetical protein
MIGIQSSPRAVFQPFTVARVCVPRLSVQCNAQVHAHSSRRTVAILLASLPIFAQSAQALIPDDDDEELVDLAKSRRKERLATEKSIENKFVKQGDYRGKDVTQIQNAVNKLAKEGLSLESGDLKSLANAASESWIGDLKKAIADLSSTEASQSSSGNVTSSLDALGKALGGGDLDKAKDSFSSAVSALQTWVGDAGITQQIKGL